jgi:3D (Asp-Asp-Asp) domain-containing protein
MRPRSHLFLSLILSISCACSLDEPGDLGAGEPGGKADNVGGHLGRFELTMYWLVDESDYSSGGERMLYEKRSSCLPIASVSRSFRRALDLEGSGRLKDGRVVSYVGACSCPRSPCYAVTDAPFGMGAKDNPLVPYRSIAVDRRYIRLERMLFIPQLNGVEMAGEHGFVHDGCVRSDDVGPAITGRHIDFFLPAEEHFLEVLGKTPSRVDIYAGGDRCENLDRVVRFIGEQCTEDEDCLAGGFCLPDSDVHGGYCTMECTSTCPDSPASETTRCVWAPEHLGGMTICAVECGDGCRTGLTCQPLESARGGSQDVCL